MTMRFTDLNPEWLGAGGEGVFNGDGSPAPYVEKVGIEFDCPCGNKDEDHRLFIPTDKAHHPKAWNRHGDDFATMTLTPSIRRMRGCYWHGFVTNGKIKTCGDSGKAP
jgi:hypothetical protein